MSNIGGVIAVSAIGLAVVSFLIIGIIRDRKAERKRDERWQDMHRK